MFVNSLFYIVLICSSKKCLWGSQSCCFLPDGLWRQAFSLLEPKTSVCHKSPFVVHRAHQWNTWVWETGETFSSHQLYKTVITPATSGLHRSMHYWVVSISMILQIWYFILLFYFFMFPIYRYHSFHNFMSLVTTKSIF